MGWLFGSLVATLLCWLLLDARFGREGLTDGGPPPRLTSVAGVLVVHGDPSVRALLREQLTTEGFAVLGEEGDGQGAIEATQRLKPDAVLMAVRLPGTDGFDAARRLQELGSPVPIVFLTSCEDAPPSIAADADDVAYVAHGCSSAFLRTIVLQACGQTASVPVPGIAAALAAPPGTTF